MGLFFSKCHKFARYGCVLCFVFCLSCGGGASIFPDLSTDVGTGTTTDLPNPISIVVDETNSQILVANSNIDVLFNQASFTVMSVDASDVSSPALTTDKIVQTPNYAGELLDAGSGTIYVSFRENLEGSSLDADGTFVTPGAVVGDIVEKDIFAQYTLTDGDVTLVDHTQVAANPFGLAQDSVGRIHVVSEDALTRFNSDLSKFEFADDALTNPLDLSLFYDSGEAEDTITISDDSISVNEAVKAENIERIAIQDSANRAFITNRFGVMFVVDLANNEHVQIVDGSFNTRDVLIDGTTMYVTDGSNDAVLVFDLTLFTDATNEPSSQTEIIELVNHDSFIVTVIPVGESPEGMVLDSVNNRLYVANAGDHSVSVIDTTSWLEIGRKDMNLLDEDDDDLDVSGLSIKRDCETPQDLALGTFNSEQYLFVACFSSHAVALIRTSNFTWTTVYPNTERE